MWLQKFGPWSNIAPCDIWKVHTQPLKEEIKLGNECDNRTTQEEATSLPVHAGEADHGGPGSRATDCSVCGTGRETTTLIPFSPKTPISERDWLEYGYQDVEPTTGASMLVLSRKMHERILVRVPTDKGSESIWITVVDVDRGRVRIGIDAPKHCVIAREEVIDWTTPEGVIRRRDPH